MNKANLRFSVLGEFIGTSFLDSIRNRCEMNGVEEPILTVEKGKINGFSVVCMEVPESQRLFWLGFIQGSHFTIANRQQWNLEGRE